ncbi:malonyl coa-acyl carrier protein transacylase [Pavlovales sp. CCMP2436]|nr:malonyl coa-acyl carrier protein transacylase [Pavlovales sp. CCMP2436]
MLTVMLCASAFSSQRALTGVRSGVRRVATRASAIREADNEFDGYTALKPFLFPGQGAQALGMGVEACASVPAARRLFEQASEVLGYDLLAKCKDGPKESLDSTVISQPAIFVASLAAVEKLRAELGDDVINAADVAAGLSLGEYTALAFAGAFSFEDGVRIVKARGEAMQAAADASSSGMVSVIGLDMDKVAALCAEASRLSGKKVQLANLLCNGNYAVSGALEACAKLNEIAKPDFGARMTVQLAVAGAFHTDFMAPAVPKLVEVLETVTIVKPRIAVISNVDAMPHSDPAMIKQLLARQVTSPVQWETTVARLMERGMKEGYELGPGKVLAGIIKRIDKSVAITNIEV